MDEAHDIRDAMSRSLKRLHCLDSLGELRGVVAEVRPVFVLFTADDCDHCPDALFIVADLSRRYATAVRMCWASLENNPDIVLNYAVTEFPSALVLRQDAVPVRANGRDLANPESVRRTLDAASRP